jgi:hypothetical protein
LLRRLIVVILDVTLTSREADRYLAFALLHFAALHLHIYVQPFAAPLLNRAETVSLTSIIVLSTLLAVFPPPVSHGMQIILFFLIIPVFFSMLLLIFLIVFLDQTPLTCLAPVRAWLHHLINPLQTHPYTPPNPVQPPSNQAAVDGANSKWTAGNAAMDIEMVPVTIASDDVEKVIQPSDELVQQHTHTVISCCSTRYSHTS